MNTDPAKRGYGRRHVPYLVASGFVTLMTLVVLVTPASAQDPSLDTCHAESVPSFSMIGLVVLAVAFMAMGVRSTSRRSRPRYATLAFVFTIIMGTLVPSPPARAVDAMNAVRCCTVTLQLLSFSVQEGSGDSPIDDDWRISTRSTDVSRPTGQGVAGGALAEGMSRGFAPAPVIGKPTRQLFPAADSEATVFQRPLKLSSSVTEVDLGGGQPFEFNEWSGFVPNTKVVQCPSVGTTTAVSAHGEGSDAFGIPVPVPPGGTVPFAARANFDVTVTYMWTVTHP